MGSNPVALFARRIGYTPWLHMAAAIVALIASLQASGQSSGPALEPIVLGERGHTFRHAESGERFRPWGFNYNRDFDGQLLHEYWYADWDRVAADF